MKITVTNIKKILENEYGCFQLDSESHKWLVDGIIEDTLKIIDDKNKLNENLCWGQGEDCEWSLRCRSFWNYKMNCNSTILLLKMGQHSSLF